MEAVYSPEMQINFYWMVTAMRTSNITLQNLFYIKFAVPFSLIRKE
jgi:hypothetical protein